MKKLTRFCCLMLVVLLLFSAIPTVAMAAETTEEKEPVDFMLVLDCSASLFYHDRERLCINACESFVDQVPVQDARVGLIGFGYGGGEPFAYSDQFTQGAMDMSKDADFVHKAIPLSDLSNREDREAFKRQVLTTTDEAFKRTQRTASAGGSLYSPVVPALAAAVDTLERSDSADDNACIILISDGVSYTRGGNYEHTAVGKRAREHGWPIYCIELNYATPASDDVEGAQKFLDEICASSGDRNVTREYCATPADVFVAFQRIFFDLWKYPEKLPADWPKALELPGEFTFSVPMLTSEATVNVFGKGVSSVTLRDPSGKEMVVTGDYERDGFIAVVEDEKYYSVKMICPKDGEWTCYVEGTGDVSVLVNSTDLQEMGLSIVANSQNPGEVLRKNDVIRVDSFFAYQDYQIHNHDIYEQTYKNAKLQVQHSNGTVREYPMNADRQGYYCELMLNEFPGGALTLQVVLEDNMFRNGRKISDAITFKTENLQLELTGNGPESLTSYVNAQFDRIDLGEIFSNPDNDNITYGLECADRSVSFDYTEADGYMTIDAGLTPGDYEVAITAKDPDMNKPLRYTMNLSVQDRVPVVEKIPEVELWVNHFGFQKEKNATQTFDLSQYIYDPDGIAMDYDVVADSLVNVTLEGSSLNFSPVEKGETVISVTASDGVSQVDAQIEVSVISAKKAFWRDNWIKFALAGALLVLLILILIFISKNTRVKGVWNISFVENDGFPIEANKVKISTMNIGRKKVFLLKDLLTAVASRLDGSLSQNLLRYIGEQKAASKIELKGVLFGNGFVVRKIPKDDAVRVVCDGSVKTGKATVRGSAKFEFQTTGGVGATDTLVITFKQSRK